MNTAALYDAISDTPMVTLPRSIESVGYKRHIEIIPTNVSNWSGISQVFLYGNILSGWAIVQPLTLNVEKEEDGTQVVSDDIFLVYGNGDTQGEAIRDYVSSLVEYFQLVEEGARTELFDKKQLIVLQSYIQSL